MEPSEESNQAEIIKRLRYKVARNPGDLDAGLLLGSVLYKTSHYEESASVFKSLLAQYPDHPQALLLLARTAARSGRVTDALNVLARAQEVSPDNPQVWQVATALAIEQRDWLELLRVARGWTGAHPDSREAWQAQSRAWFEESQFSEAIAAYERVLALEPENPSFLIDAARIAIAAHNYAGAQRHLDAAQKISPDSADLLYTLGRLYHLTGKLDAAEDCFRRVIALRPRFAPAYVELGTLCEGRLVNAEIRMIRQMFEDATVHPEYRVMLGFTLGNALDRREGSAEEAFAAWDAGNEINRRISEQEGIFYQPELVESELELLPELFRKLDYPLEHSVCEHPRPIFVLGMPRSGTTLIESILAAHSGVHGAGELPTLYDIHEELMGVARSQGVEAARELLRSEAAGWRQRYLAALPPVDGKPNVVDKQPLNYRSIGLIRMLFPESPIIYTRRSPMDVGFSIYRHKFSKNWPCAHRLADIGHYYGIHARLAACWEERHKGAIHSVDHAALVRDPEKRIRELLAYTGLEFEAACLSHHKTKRAVATFSAVQVQQPVSDAYSNRAARYADKLVPLRDALQRAGVDIPDA